MDQINITLSEVSKTAHELRQYNLQLQDELLHIRQVMLQLANTWQSPAATTIQQKFSSLLPLFENYKEVIEAYAKFLDVSVASYEATEKQIQQNASTFQ